MYDVFYYTVMVSGRPLCCERFALKPRQPNHNLEGQQTTGDQISQRHIQHAWMITDEEEIYGTLRTTASFDSFLSSVNSMPFSEDDHPEPEENGFVSSIASYDENFVFLLTLNYCSCHCL